MTSRIIIDCTTPYEWGEEERPAKIYLDDDMATHVKDHWDEYFG
jgi:3-polyprenyl-4-hydroxybenzoate decarboxylase